jgi:hypothetical protein
MVATPKKIDCRGLYRKFLVRRTDGKSRKGCKHTHCRYFVLDLSCDGHAKAAVRAYINSCKRERPALAQDLQRWLETGHSVI